MNLLDDVPLRELILRVQRGDRESFRQVIVQTESKVRMVVAAILPPGSPALDDVVQETYLVAWRKIASVRDDGENIPAWFAQIARNIAMNERRRHLRDLRRQSPIEADLIDQLPVPFAPSAIEGGIETELQNCLQALSDQAREVVMAHYWHGREVEWIASSHQHTVGWVRVVLSRARTALARCLSQKGILHATT